MANFHWCTKWPNAKNYLVTLGESVSVWDRFGIHKLFETSFQMLMVNEHIKYPVIDIYYSQPNTHKKNDWTRSAVVALFGNVERIVNLKLEVASTKLLLALTDVQAYNNNKLDCSLTRPACLVYSIKAGSHWAANLLWPTIGNLLSLR